MISAVLTAADLPPGQPYVSPDDLSAITPLWQEASEATLIPIVAQVYNDAAGALHARLVDAADGAVPAITSLASEQYLAAARNTFNQVGNELWETARNELLEGFQKGESIPELRDRLRQSAGLTSRRATLVARTQVLDASNAGSYDTAQASGLDLVKGWEATPDLRTRETHLMAGSTYSGPGMIPMAEMFMVGGWPCERPHDPELPPEERYNCRCTLVYQMRHVPVDPHQAYLDDLAAQHQAKLAAIRAQYEKRLAAIEAKHQAKLTAIEITSVTPSVSVETAIVNSETKLAQAVAAHEARKAKLLADYEFRHSKLMSDYTYRVAKAKGEIPPPQPPFQLPEIPKAPAAPAPSPPPQPIGPPGVVVHAKPVDIPIRDSLANAKTIPEVRAAFIREWRDAIAAEPGAIRGSARFLVTGDVQTAREHAEGLLRAIERFPMVRIDVSHGPMQPHWAETAGRVISFSDEFAVGRDDYLLSLRLAGIPDPTGAAWRPMSISSPQAVAMHEFGHALHNSVYRDPSTGLYELLAYSRLTHEIDDIRRQLATERGLSYVDVARVDIGGYATTNAQELAAEAFADVMVNGDAASELSQRIVAMLIRRYEAQNGPMSGPPLVGLPKLPAKGKPALKLEAPSEARFTLAADTGASGDGYAAPGLWGRYGAGGVLTRVETSSGPRFLLVQRGPAVSSNVGKWQLPGGAFDELETVYQGIARETIEELSASESWMNSLVPVAEHVFQHPSANWRYTSVIARAPKRFTPVVDGTETGAARWFTQAQLEKMLADGKIVPGLEPTLQDLIAGFEQTTAPKVTKLIKLTDLDDTTLRRFTDQWLKAHPDTKMQYGFLSKTQLVKSLRLLGVTSQDVTEWQTGLDLALSRALTEALDIIQRFKTTAPGSVTTKVRDLLLKRPGAEEALSIAKSAVGTGWQNLERKLLALVEKRGLTLPSVQEVKKAAREAAAAVRAQKAAATAIQRQVKAVERGDFSSLVRVGPQAGSNPGGVFVDASGQKWYVKEASEEWAREQQYAAALYNVGSGNVITTPPIVVGQGTPGLARWQVATRILEAENDLADKLKLAATGDPASFATREAIEYLDTIRQNFAMDAWLANWDVAGLNFDNIVTVAGRPIRIDVGGTLRFRAQGGAKGDAFSRDVAEWLTLRDPAKSPTGSQLFAGMTKGQLLEAVARVKAVTPARVEALGRKYGVSPKLIERLIERRQSILDLASAELDLAGNFNLLLRTALTGDRALQVPSVRLTGRVSEHKGIAGVTAKQADIERELYDYRGFSGGLNDALRSNGTGSRPISSWNVKSARIIDDALDQSPLREPVVVYRGVQSGAVEDMFGAGWSTGGRLLGREWDELAYLSTSTAKTTSSGFAGHGGLLMRIVVPRGINGILLSGKDYEREIMFDRDLILRIVRVHSKDSRGRIVVDVEVVGRRGTRRLVS